MIHTILRSFANYIFFFHDSHYFTLFCKPYQWRHMWPISVVKFIRSQSLNKEDTITKIKYRKGRQRCSLNVRHLLSDCVKSSNNLRNIISVNMRINTNRLVSQCLVCDPTIGSILPFFKNTTILDTRLINMGIQLLRTNLLCISSLQYKI